MILKSPPSPIYISGRKERPPSWSRRTIPPLYIVASHPASKQKVKLPYAEALGTKRKFIVVGSQKKELPQKPKNTRGVSNELAIETPGQQCKHACAQPLIGKIPPPPPPKPPPWESKGEQLQNEKPYRLAKSKHSKMVCDHYSKPNQLGCLQFD